MKIIYSDVGDCLRYNFWNNNLGDGTIEDVDPMFASLDPADPYFLYLMGVLQTRSNSVLMMEHTWGHCRFRKSKTGFVSICG